MYKVINILARFLFLTLLFYFILVSFTTPVKAINTWQPTSNLPYQLASHTSVRTQDKIFIINGSANFRSSRSTILSNNQLQNGSLNAWYTESLNTPTALIWHVSAINNSYIYILGGNEENNGSAMSYVNKVFMGKISNGFIESWNSTTNLPQVLSLGSALTSENRLFYAGGIGGNNGNFYSNEIYKADIDQASGTLSIWNDIGNLPTSLSGFGMFNQGNKIIITGGENLSGKKDKSYFAEIAPDGTVGTWIETSPLPKPLSRAQFTKSGTKIFAIGGINSDGTPSDDVYFTDINPDGSLKPWQVSTYKIPQPTCCGTSEVIGNYIYLIGGHNPSTADYYDDVYYAHINEITGEGNYETLDVPFFSQNSLPWGEKEYDHAKSLKFAESKFERWGCAVTSVAMVMKYHKINVLPDGKPIDPGSLNTWLKDNKGYLTGKDDDGSYSYLNFPIISTLSQKIFKAGKSRYKLEYYREKATVNNLDTFLNVNKHPVILKVANEDTSSHFVVAKGKTSNSYRINDPEWNYSELTSFNNNFSQIDRFVPVHSNLSYLVIVVNPNTHLLITDGQGRKTGSVFKNGQINNYDEIPGATYSYQAPISNPDLNNEMDNLGTGVNEFLLPKPLNGNYKIQVSSNENRKYELNIAAFQENGDYQTEKIKGNTKYNETINIDYNLHRKAKVKRIKTCKALSSSTGHSSSHHMDKDHDKDDDDWCKRVDD